MMKAGWLRRLTHEEGKFLSSAILHVASYDAVPTAAFRVEGGPPVGLINHADHAFWTGSTDDGSSDPSTPPKSRGTVIEQRRSSHKGIVLPIPLADTNPQLSRKEIRARLGIPNDPQMMLLSVESAGRASTSPTPHTIFLPQSTSY